jgi:hypothetical protein
MKAEDAILQLHNLYNTHGVDNIFVGKVDGLKIWIEQDEYNRMLRFAELNYGAVISSKTAAWEELSSQYGPAIRLEKDTQFSKKSAKETFELIIKENSVILITYAIWHPDKSE